MILQCQQNAINSLSQFAKADRHSVLIEGPQGCGKTYLAAEYGRMLNIVDLVSINATVADLRTMLDNCYSIDTPVVVCIEGLDDGQLSASYVLLKFLEEPKNNVYVVITCSNISKIPDTILSRSVVTTIAHPVKDELMQYITSKYPEKLVLFNHPISKAFKTFKDVDVAVKLSSEELQYYEDIVKLSYKDTVTNLAWKLGHYSNNEESNPTFVFRCILNSTTNNDLKRVCINTLKDLESKRMGSHAVLSKFAFDFKYGV